MRGRMVSAALVMTAWRPAEAQVPPLPPQASISRGITVDEMIALATFGDIDAAGAKVSISPNGRFLIAIEERSTPNRERLHANLLLWRIADLDPSVAKSGKLPSPVRLGSFASVDGPVISSIKWADDSRSIAALVNEGQNHESLWRVALTGTKQRVSLPAQNVRTFDVAASTILYTASANSPVDGPARISSARLPFSQIGTGKALEDLLFPGDNPDPSEWVGLWRWSGSRPGPITVRGAIRLSEDRNPLALSPDGKSAIVDFPVIQVPDAWGQFSVDTRFNVTAKWTSGPQRFTNTNGLIPHQFYLLHLDTGAATAFVDAPDALSRGFLLPSAPQAAWSKDASHAALSATFLPGRPTPCVAVVDLTTGITNCVMSIEKAFDRVRSLEFVDGLNDQMRIDIPRAGAGRNVELFAFDRASSTWNRKSTTPVNIDRSARFYVKEDMNHPPVLVYGQQNGGRVIYDPNPQFDRSRLAEWKTLAIPLADGTSISAGLLVPDGPAPTGGFPLVIQTHGFDPSVFSPSGIYSAPFAAQAFVKEGFAVIQLPMSCRVGEVDETPCFLKQYKSAISLLAGKGIADPNRLAIIGFSRTAIHVLAALTDQDFNFKAAILQNGYLNTLSQYFGSIDYVYGFVNGWMNKMIGGKPYGDGLMHWMSNSPTFRYDHLDAPLRVEANGKLDTLFMWEPYAAMRDRGMPADFIIFRQGTHPLTNPAERLASQQGVVDWFTYWVMGKKDLSPEKQAQYRRWDAMKRDAPPK